MTDSMRHVTGSLAPVRLHPKEHGAYAIVGVPLVTALAIGGLNTVAILTTIAAVAGFVANEPLMVFWGRRGDRARVSTPSALPTLELLLFTAVLSGSLAFWLGSETVRIGLVVCGIFAVAGFAMSIAGWQRTLTAQFTGIIGLTLPSTVVLLAGKIDSGIVVRFFAAWIIGRVATTITVRSIVALQKTSTHHQVPRINDVLLSLSVLATVGGFLTGTIECLLVTPLVASAIIVRLGAPHVRHARRIGYSFLAANIMTGLSMIVWCASALSAA